jgi:hypothetical protein
MIQHSTRLPCEGYSVGNRSVADTTQGYAQRAVDTLRRRLLALVAPGIGLKRRREWYNCASAYISGVVTR